jgi:hypothetical protein
MFPPPRHDGRRRLGRTAGAASEAEALLADPLNSAADLFWAVQSGIVTSRVAPSRDSSNSALWWGAAAFTAAVRSANELTGVPSTESSTSPSTIPALAAALPASTLRTIRPRSEPILSAVADPGETGRNTTPRRDPWCATREGGPDGLGGPDGVSGGLTIEASTGFGACCCSRKAREAPQRRRETSASETAFPPVRAFPHRCQK